MSELGNMEQRIDRMRTRLTQIETQNAAHEQRLKNGIEVFRELKNEINEIRPKPPNPYKIAGIVFAVMMAAAGALWALANHLRDRPTLNQVQEILSSHDHSGHRSIRENLRQIEQEQSKQRQLLEDRFGRLEKMLEEKSTRKRRRRR